MTKAKLSTLCLALAGALVAPAAMSAENLNKPKSGDVAPPAAPGDRGMAIMSAAINGDGSIARGEGVVLAGTSKLGVGVYQVGFDRDITECAYQVTAGESSIGSATPRMVAVTRRSGNANGVFLQIRDQTAAGVDNPFFVLVYCGR